MADSPSPKALEANAVLVKAMEAAKNVFEAMVGLRPDLVRLPEGAQISLKIAVPEPPLHPDKSDNEALAQHIEFLSGRLIHVYKENDLLDYFHRSRKYVEHLRRTDG